MQVAGKTCVACGQWVVLGREGTWCPLFVAAILLARMFDSVERFFPGRDAVCWLLAGWPIVICVLLAAGQVALQSGRSLNRAWWLIRFH